MKKGDKVLTPDGKGVFSGKVDLPLSHNRRYGILLENNPFSYPIAYYRRDELSKTE